MTYGPAVPSALDVAARAVLHHPDQRSGWVVVMGATLPAPPDLERLAVEVPLTAARLVRTGWVPGRTAAVIPSRGDPLLAPEAWRRFDLGAEAPVRVVADGTRVAVAVHHAAFDGRSLHDLVRLLAGADPVDAPLPPPVDTATGGMWRPVRRVLRPADVVAPSVPPPPDESRAWAPVHIEGPGPTARVADAVTTAVAEHNRRLGRPWRQVGISLGVGGPPGIGNRATYRRIDVDLTSGASVRAAIGAALASGPEPAELRRAPRALRLLAPLASRLGDSFLVSNLGPVVGDRVRDVVFFPVARGRSAVAFGLVGPMLSVRARDLSRADAEALLATVIANLR